MPPLPLHWCLTRTHATCSSHLLCALSCQVMGVQGGFLGFLEGARRLRRLKELPRLGQYATAALDASVWLHQLATGVDAVASMKGNYQSKYGSARELRGHKAYSLALSAHEIVQIELDTP